MQVKVIKARADYDIALRRLNALLDLDPADGTDLADELDLLLVVIKAYERATVPPAVVDPVEAILFRMEQMGLSRKDLEAYLGTPSRVSEVLSHRRPLSIAMVRKLHRGLGISADILIEQVPGRHSKEAGFSMPASA